jgi:hypothetical protein
MDVRLLFPNLYFSAADLRGQDTPLTITRLQVDELKSSDGSSQRKPVLYFAEAEARAAAVGNHARQKRLVLNKTNMRTIAGMYGFEATDWIGKRIVLYPTKDRAFGKEVDCIRVRPQAAPPPAQAPSPAVVEANGDNGPPAW